MRYKDRAAYAKNSIAKKLFQIMEEKQTNLCVSADVTTMDELLELTKIVAPYICILKTHIDIISDFSHEKINKLQVLAKQEGFLLFEDRKFADIGNTVRQQYEGGIYHIADWADIINAHALPGPGIIKGLKQRNTTTKSGLLLIAQMSSEGSLFSQTYTQQTISLAQKYADTVMGYICQQKLSDNPGFIHMTPGVRMGDTQDALGQQYNTPAAVIGKNQSDIIIVGRGIYTDADPSEAAKEYRDVGWHTYLEREKNHPV